jgi:hypothetical protein
LGVQTPRLGKPVTHLTLRIGARKAGGLKAQV